MGIVYLIMTLALSFDESDTESGSFDEHSDLDNLVLNEQRLNNWPRTQMVQ